MGGRLQEYRIFGQWEKIVGAAIARHAQPVTVRGKKLSLVVDSPAWMQQLSLLKPQIIEKVNASLREEAIKDITLRLGEIALTSKPDDPLPVRASLNDEERATIEKYLQGVEDAEIRESIRRVVEKDIQNKKRMLSK